MPVLVLGTVGLDDLSTPRGIRKDELGGSATYFAWACAFLAPTALVAAVGEDFPARYRADLAAQGIDLRGLTQAPGARTFRWQATYDPDGEVVSEAVQRGVLLAGGTSIPAGFRRSRRVFLASDEPAHQLGALDQLDAGAFVLCDTKPAWIEADRDGVLRVMRRCDGIVVNAGEARLLTATRDLRSAAERLQALGASRVIVKQGSRGCFLLRAGKVVRLPAYPVGEVLDPTGAGDCFAGGLMGSLERYPTVTDEALVRGMAVGSVLASFCVEGFGLDGLKAVDRVGLAAREAEFLRSIRL